jgi:ATP-dependent DNA ligase
MTSKRSSAFAIEPPIEPMLAKLAEELPPEGSFLYEPKWDGFRAIVFRGGSDVYIQSRDLRPLDRYFPELHDALIEKLPDGCVIDGEIVIATRRGLDFNALQMRLHAFRRIRRPCGRRPRPVRNAAGRAACSP